MNNLIRSLTAASLAVLLLVSAAACTQTPADPSSTDASDTTASDTTASDTTASDTTAPDTTAPDTTAPETTVPELVPVDTAAVDAYVASHTRLNIVECGADPTGAKDSTDVMQYVHSSGKEVFYPNGTYRFNGATLDFSGGVVFESYNGVLIRNNISDEPIVNFDDFGNFIGLMQNHLESKEGSVDAKNGSLVEPPLSTAHYETPVDFIPHWYQDFGLVKSLYSYNWKGWYTWEWNHHDCADGEGNTNDPYDPSRHPLLGYYYGDDPVVLDWQCYWLREYGINNVMLLGSPNMSTWDSDPSNAEYWVYQLFNHVKNFQEMGYILEATYYQGTEAEMEASWKNSIDVYKAYPHYYTRQVDGKTYVLLFNWLESTARKTVGSTDIYVDMIGRVSDYARETLGVDGLILVSRSPSKISDAQTAQLAEHGALHYKGTYEYNCLASSVKPKEPSVLTDTYEKCVNSFRASDVTADLVVGIATGMETHTPHPSDWKIGGSSPELFEIWAKKAVDAVVACPDNLGFISIYNMSEWAEGGPGIQPNVRDGFGYLDALANALGIQIREKVK